MTTRDQVRSMYQKLGTWEAVGNALGVNRAVAWRFANEPGWEPRNKSIRERLGLSELVMRRQSVRRDPKTGRFIRNPAPNGDKK